MVTEPRGTLTCRSLTLAILAILTRFMDYYSTFWAPKAIIIVAEPQGELTYRSLTLTVLADSDPFHGLLLTVLR